MLDNATTSDGTVPLKLAQKVFSSALLKPDDPTPFDVVGPTKNKKAEKRFRVYRNNVVMSLSEVLMSTYPTIVQLVGEEYFRAMARVFVMANPPNTPMLSTFGGGFADFLDDFEPVRTLPYLGDVARLEYAWLTAYHAADHAPLNPARLQQVDPEQMGNLTFVMHPACQILTCKYAAFSIWAAHKQDNPADAMKNLHNKPEDILITRPQWDVTVISLPAGGFSFIKALSKGQSLGEAATTAAEANDAFDFAQNLGGLFETGALIDLKLLTQ